MRNLAAVTVTAATLLLLGTTVRAQDATATASQGMRLQTYVLGSYVKPQFATTNNSVGGTVGADLNLFHFKRFEPSIDARASAGFGTTSEFFVGGGPRVAVNLGRVHPYADFLVGYGAVNFHSIIADYTHNNSVVTAFGGGVDFSLNRSWALRADVQRQSWQITNAAPNFYPVTASFGIRYQFHFKNKNGPE